MIAEAPAPQARKNDPILVQRWSQDTESFLVFNPKEEAVAQLSLMVSQSNNKLFKDAFEAMNADNQRLAQQVMELQELVSCQKAMLDKLLGAAPKGLEGLFEQVRR